MLNDWPMMVDGQRWLVNGSLIMINDWPMMVDDGQVWFKMIIQHQPLDKYLMVNWSKQSCDR